MNNTKETLDFESSVAYLVDKSNKRAWLIAFIASIIAFISIIAVMLLTPLKTTEPYVIRVDNVTGMVDILTTLDEKQITKNEALDKYFIGKYVKAREGYYYEMLNNDYVLVQLFSNNEVAQGYRAIYSGENSRDSQLQNNYIVNADIISIVLGDSNGNKTSTIRALITTKNKNNNSESKQNIVITLAYDYFLTSVKEAERVENPLGFKVTSYRIDAEI